MKGRPACLKTLKKALSLNLSLVEYVRAAHKEILLSAVQLTDPPHYIFVPVAYLAGIQIRKFIPYAVGAFEIALTGLQVTINLHIVLHTF